MLPTDISSGFSVEISHETHCVECASEGACVRTERTRVILDPYRTCPAQLFRHAGTHLGRAAGRDFLAAVDLWSH